MFISLKHELELTQVITFPTRGNATLVLFLTNRPSLINSCDGIPGISDHDTIACIESNILAEYKKPIKRKILLWKKGNIDSMRAEMIIFSLEFQQKYSEKNRG